jgi:hypothetical protein
MDWIFDHLQFVIAAAAAVAYWLNQRRTAAKEEAETDKRKAARFPRANVDESQDADRARQVRDEIRRKIAERAGGRTKEAPANPPPPLVRREADEWRRIFRPEPTPPAREPVLVPADDEMAAVLERQRKLNEQMAALERAQQAEKHAAWAAAAGVAAPVNAPRQAGGWRGELKNGDGLRRAVILREILGPPVGLR